MTRQKERSKISAGTIFRFFVLLVLPFAIHQGFNEQILKFHQVSRKGCLARKDERKIEIYARKLM
jgi:hypothetical protein